MDQGTACGHSGLAELGVPFPVAVAGVNGAGADDDIDYLVIEVAYVVAYVLTVPPRSGMNAVVDAGSVLLSVLVLVVEVGTQCQWMGAANVVGAVALRQWLAFRPRSQPLYGVE